MANLFPELYTNEEELVQNDIEEKVTGYHPGAFFDFESGDYKRTGTNMISESTGIEAWEQWCIKCLSTHKGSCAAYYDFGIDYESIIGETYRDKVESILRRNIKESLLADPYERTLDVTDIEFDWSIPDSLIVKATIVGIENVTKDIVVTIGGV